jgi:N-terminal domain of M60-like peptidases/Peptidase M60, enhancin and enhancin-like/Concanavalin A-like lectin/glucanases superfamily
MKPQMIDRLKQWNRSATQAVAALLLCVLTGCGGGSTGESSSGKQSVSGVELTDCAFRYRLPAVTGCDGVLLTAPKAIDTQTDGIVQTQGPNGLAALRFSAGQTMNLKDKGCLQLGKNGNDFSVSMWLKAPLGTTQILSSAISQYGGDTGFILHSNPVDGRVVLSLESALKAGVPRKTVLSVPFDAGAWARVTVTYSTNQEGSVGAITVNGVATSGAVHGTPYAGFMRVGEVPGFNTTATFEIADLRSFGRVLSEREVRSQWLDAADFFGLSATALSDGISRLQAHNNGTAVLDAAAFAAAVGQVTNNAVYLPTSERLTKDGLALLDTYESSAGPLFDNPGSTGGVARVPAADETAAVREARGMLAVFQAVHDEVFRGESVGACKRVLNGRGWKTADYFPGKVTSPLDTTKIFTARINATVPAQWGRAVAFVADPKLRPTGLYLPPGAVARVTVPPALVGAGYAVQVGAHTVDHTDKDIYTRPWRVSRRFDIEKQVTYVANPLGGGVYIQVPYLANPGMVDVQVQGVVKAPMFSLRTFDVTTPAQWQQRRNAGAPWVDVVSDNFMMQVPSNWVYARADLTSLVQAWDVSMQGQSELFGIPPDKRNDVTLYLQPDVQIRHTQFGIGYPQVNSVFFPGIDEKGASKNPLVVDPLTTDSEFHELGHAQQMSYFRGESEAIVNFPYVYIANTKFGMDFDEAFRRSFDNPDQFKYGFTPDRAAVDWMVTVNFGNGAEMDYSNTEYDEFRYQHRGYAKYADIARLFGWDALKNFYYQENLDLIAGTPGDGLSATDSRILRLSVAAGADLTPLIHFWGIHPENAAALRSKIVAKGLKRSTKVKNLLIRYRSLIPADNAEFAAHFDAVYPGMPTSSETRYGPGWYQVRMTQWDTGTARLAQRAVDNIVAQYFP